MRTCPICLLEKDETEFPSRYRWTGDGFIRGSCKQCHFAAFMRDAERHPKPCTRCGKAKTLAEYPRPKNNRKCQYLIWTCRECLNKRSKARHHERKHEPDYRKQLHEVQKRRRAKKYGLSVDDVEAMLKAQDGKCAICGEKNSGNRINLYVDHDHKTGKVRGLLCHHCNTGIGQLGDDIRLVQAAVEYLKREAST